MKRARMKKRKYKYRTPPRRRYYSPRSKYKRYRRKNPIVIALIVVVIAAAAFLLVSVAKPFYMMITGQLTENDVSSVPSAVSDVSSGVSSGVSSEPAVSAETEPIKALSVPEENMESIQAIKEFAAGAKQQGYDTIMLELKNEAGELLYASENEEANSYGAVASELTAEEIYKAVSDEGLKAVAAIHTLRDPLAANRANENCLMLKGENATWLDNTLENGGKSWLDVFKKKAVDYLNDIETELLEAGFDGILLRSVQYPDVQNSSNIDFPEGTDDAALQKALSDYVEQANEIALEYDAFASMEYDAQAVAGEKENIYFGNVFDITASNISPAINFELFDKTITAGEIKVKNAAENLGDALSALFEQAEDSNIIPVVYADSSERVIESLEEIGINSYIVE